MKLKPAIRSAAISAVISALFLVIGYPHNFPGGWFGFGGFVVAVFLLGLYLHDKVD